MCAMPVVVIQGTTGPLGALVGRPIYAAMAGACGAGPAISLRSGGIGGINQTYEAFAADVDRHLGREPGTPAANELPAILVVHSLAVPLALKYLTVHTGDHAVLVGGPVQGLEYMRLATAWVNLSTMLWPPVVRESIYRALPMLKNLSPDSPFLVNIRANSASYAHRVVSVVAENDTVIPWPNSLVPGAPTVLLSNYPNWGVCHLRGSDKAVKRIFAPGIDHLGLMTHPVALSVVVALIAGVRDVAHQPRSLVPVPA